jgi:multidrug efflux pump subunit AcrA (membrane-fusion protein)
LAFFGLGLGLVVFNFIQTETTVEAPALAETQVYAPAKPTNTITYPVAGLVEAGEAITLYAKRSGFVEQVVVQEGDVVNAGSALVVAVDPVTRSRLAVQDEAGLLNTLKATSAVIGANQQAAVATINYGDSVALATLTNAASSARTAAAEKQLALTLSQVEAVVPQALRFVQDNKSLFTNESMDLYTEVVEAFYKQEPNYLRIGFTTSGDDTALLTRVAEVKTASSSEMLAVAELVGDELGTLIELYAQSESEFFDKDQLASEATELAAYSEFRTSLAELSAGLVAATDGAATLGDREGITDITATSSVASALISKDTAASLRAITEQIENATGQLSNAELTVLMTELGLGLSEAPFAGVVTDVYVEIGQYVEAGQPLLRLSGSGAQEMKIKLSGAAVNLQVGDAFLIDGKTAGVVDRVVPVLEAGSATAYITFTEAQVVGSVVRGELGVTIGAGLHSISRDYLAFDSTGPYVVTKAGEKIYLKIVHDNGAELVVEGERELNEELVSVFGIRL